MTILMKSKAESASTNKPKYSIQKFRLQYILRKSVGHQQLHQSIN